MKTITWKDMSDLGLVERINNEILNPLGLAVSWKLPENISDTIFVADDGVFEYGDGVELKPILSKEEIAFRVYSLCREDFNKGGDV